LLATQNGCLEQYGIQTYKYSYEQKRLQKRSSTNNRYSKVNGYKEEIILKLVKKHNWLKHIRNTSTLQQNHLKDKKRAALIHIPQLSNKISKIFKKYNIDIVSLRNNNFKSLQGNTKDKLKETEKSGIYKIQCEICEKCYLGQTKRNIGIRFKEHIRNIVLYVSESNHNINTVQLLKQVTKNQKATYEKQ